MEKSARKKIATRPIPLAILGLMFGILGLMFQTYTVFGDAFDLEGSFLLWVIGFGIVAWAVWGELAKA